MTLCAHRHRPDHRGQLERLARRGTASVVGAGFSAVFGVLLVVVVTNGFSPTVAGTLFAATSAFLILESVALLGTDTGLVRWLPAQLASGRAADLRRTLVVSAVPGPRPVPRGRRRPCTSRHRRSAPHLVGPEAADTMTVMLRALALVLPVAALHDLVLAATRGAGSMRPTVLVENIGRLGLQAVAVLVRLPRRRWRRSRSPWPGRCPTCWAWPSPASGCSVLVARRTTSTGTPTGLGHPRPRVLGLHRAARDRAGHPDRR